MYVEFITKDKKLVLVNFGRVHFIAESGKNEYKIVTDYLDFFIDKKTFEKVQEELISNQTGVVWQW